MKRSMQIKFLSLIFCMMVAASALSSCGDEKKETEAPTETLTEAVSETVPKVSESSEITEIESTVKETAETFNEKETETSEETTAAPECGGVHNWSKADWKSDADGHSRDACEYCGEGGVDAVSHAFNADNDEGIYLCAVCDYIPECKGEHWVIAPEGHSMPACDICGFEGYEYMEAPHAYIYDSDTYVCDTCGYAPECKGIHEWVIDEKGHAMNTCEKCYAETVDYAEHVYMEVSNEHQNGEKKYSYVCSTCGYKVYEKSVPAYVNYYSDLFTMNHFKDNATYMERFLYDEDAQVAYNRITTDSSTHVNITGGEFHGTATAEAYEPGRYLIIKYRTYGGRSIAAYILNKDTKLFDVNVNDSWVVSVIDLEGVNGYPSEPSPVYIMLLANAKVDVAYAAIVDSLDEMRALVSDSVYAYHGKDNRNAPEIRNTSNDSVHSHAVEDMGRIVTNDDGSKTYTAVCKCGYSLSSKTVPASVGYYGGAVEIAYLLNNEVSAVYLPWGYKFTTEIDGGIAYTRSSNRQLLLCRGYADRTNGESNQGDRTLDIGNSKYLVLTVRSGASDRSFTVNFSTEGKNSKTEVAQTDMDGKDINGDPITVGSTYATDNSGISPAITVKMDGPANTWETYVIDLSAISPEHFVKKDGANGYVIDTFYLTWGEDYAESHTDFANIVFADDWKAIDAIVDNATVKNITKADGTYSKVNVVEAADPEVYITGFMGAEHIYNRLVNVYSDGNIEDPWYQRVDHIANKEHIKDDPECENGYWRGNINISATQDIYWNKEAPSGTSYVNRVLDAGTARFLVIRMRVNSEGNDRGLLELYLSTVGGENKCINLPYVTDNKGKWITYVLDMDEGLTENGEKTVWLTKTSDGIYLFDEINMVFKQNAEVDIEYMAFIRGDWKNVAAFTGEEAVVKLTHMNGESCEIVEN